MSKNKDATEKSPETPRLFAELKKLGMKVTHDYDYVGDHPNRRRVEKEDKITDVTIPLTPEEWASLCMRDGADYIGGCCGQTSAIQDILNGVFRDSGSMDGKTLYEFISAASHHEGFEDLQEPDEEKLLKKVKKWDKLRPMDKLVLAVKSVAWKMVQSWLDVPKGRKNKKKRNTEDDNVIDALYGAASYLRYKDLYSDDDPIKKTVKKSGQSHGNLSLRLARAIPAAKSFIDVATRLMEEPFKGVAIVDPDGEILTNGFGYCLYYTEEEAQKVIDLWKKSNDEVKNEDVKSNILDQLSIKKATVSAEKGLKIE